MKTIPSLSPLPLTVALALVAGSAFALDVVRLDPAAQERAGVRLEAVESRPFGDSFRVVGRAVRAPGATTTVKSILEGRILTLRVAPGDTVEAGEPLVELHSHTLHQLQGELLRTNQELDLAKSLWHAGQQLYELQGISRLELDRREQQFMARQIDVHNTEAELHDLGYSESEIEELSRSRELHPRLTVRSPVAGVVLEVGVQPHEWVQPFDDLLVVGNPANVELELQLPPDQAAAVRPGDGIRFRPVGAATGGGTAEVVSQVPQVDPKTRTVSVRARVLDGRESVVPGVFVEGTLTRGPRSPAPSVPEEAVIRVGSGDRVFVRLDGESFEARQVSLGRLEDGRWEVVEGLIGDEQVAVEGVFLLKSALVRGEG